MSNCRLSILLGQREKDQQLLLFPIFWGQKVILLAVTLGEGSCDFLRIYVTALQLLFSTSHIDSLQLVYYWVQALLFSSPHIQSIRERISLGRSGDPVPAKTLNNLFQKIKLSLEQALEQENGCISHFEVLTVFSNSKWQKNVRIYSWKLVS